MRIQIGRLFWIAVPALAALPFFIEGTYYKFLGIIVFIYGIVAVGLNVLAGYGGQFSLGHAALMAMGAYTTALLSKALAPLPLFATTGLHVWLGIAAGTVVAALFGAFLAIPALRVRGPYLAMVTIAFGWVIWKILQEWVSVTGGDLGIASIPKPQIGFVFLDTQSFYFVVFTCFVIALILQHRLIESQFGMRLRAVKHSEIGVASVGVDVYRLKVIVFVISAAFAGFGGTLFAHQQNYISPDNFQFFSSVFFLLAVLFGGAGTKGGPVIGAAVLTLLPEMLHDFDKYRLIVYGCFILFTLYFLPNGIMGMLSGATKGQRTPTVAAPDEQESPHEHRAVGGAALRVENLSRAFGGVRALSAVSFSVAPGCIHALIGPNGAGKTTLINIVSGIYAPDGGRILVDEVDSRTQSMHEAAQHGIVRTFQTLKLFGDMTVLEHVMLGFARHSRAGVWDALVDSRQARDEAVRHRGEAHALIRFVGLSGFEDVPANALAYGHRRLVEIARALAVQPKLLLLDEPAAGLVADEIEALAAVIRRLQQAGMTILLVEHHMELVLSVSERITVLDHGEVLADGTPDEIRRDPRVIAAYLGSSHATA